MAGRPTAKTIFADGSWLSVCRICGWATKPVAKRSECASLFRMDHPADACPAPVPAALGTPA